MRKKERKWTRSVLSDSLQPHRLQPTMLLLPWDFPGKSTGVGCHFLGPPKTNGSWSDKTGPLEKDMANHFSIPALSTPWTVRKGKKIGHWKMNSLVSRCPILLLDISGEITPERRKRWSQNKNNTQLWMWLVMKVKSDAIKGNIA